MRALLIGNYGTGNLGDEALREYFVREFPRVEWRVVSAHPSLQELPRLPAGVRSFCSLRWWRTVAEYRHADAVVFGGGTLFTDSESLLACILWFLHAALAVLVRKPLFLAFQGIGPFRTRTGEWCARYAVSHAASVSVRDDASLRRVEAWKMNKKTVRSFDPIYSRIVERKGDGTQSVLLVIPRGNSTDTFRVRVGAEVKKESWNEVRVVSMAPDDPRELLQCSVLRSLLKEQGMEASIVPVRTLPELVSQMEVASFVLTQRYHGAIAAMAAGVQSEVIPQREGDKLAELTPWTNLDSGGRADLTARVEEGRRALEEAFARIAAESEGNR